MKLNRVEKALMNNPVRSLLQRQYEARLLQRLGGRTEGLRVLEVGCGHGVGAEIIVQRFGALRVFAFDLDFDAVQQARRRSTVSSAAPVVQWYVADASAIPAGDASFDAVFDFGAIHHVPDRRAAVAEVRRVIRPDGRFFFEEVTRRALNRWVYRTFLRHPEHDRFSGDEFVSELEGQGIIVARNFVYRVGGDFILGVGRARGTVPTATLG